METVSQIASKLRGLNWRYILRCAAVMALIALIVTSCIFASSASRMKNEYTSARQSVAEALYGAVYMMAREFDGASLAGADVEGGIIPTMWDYWQQAQALDSALNEAFGNKCDVLTGDITDLISRAFTEYNAAFRAGHSTDSAFDLMTQAMTAAKSALENNYDNNARLRR